MCEVFLKRKHVDIGLTIFFALPSFIVRFIFNAFIAIIFYSLEYGLRYKILRAKG